MQLTILIDELLIAPWFSYFFEKIPSFLPLASRKLYENGNPEKKSKNKFIIYDN